MMIPAMWNETWTVALVNHLWQSTMIVGIAWLLTLTLRGNHARLRYWIWTAASIKFLIPFSVLTNLGSHWAKPGPVSITRSEIYSAMDQASQPFSQPSSRIATSAGLAGHSSVTYWLPQILTLLWLCGLIVILTLWLVRWLRVLMIVRTAVTPSEGRELDALRRMERSAGMRRPVRMLLSSSPTEPGIFGVVRPILLWPTGISSYLEDAQLDAVLAHELCHVRRRDNLAAMLHMVIEALFWFHPAVWWIGRHLVEERELACDEDVLQRCEQPQIYAESILKVCQFCLGSSLACVSGVTGADLKKRIERIMIVSRGSELSLARKMLLTVAAFAVLCGPISSGLLYALQANARLLQPAGATHPGFEVSTIKPNNDAGSGLRFQFSPTGFNATHASLKDLIEFAYVTKSKDQVVGAPAWSDSEYFDIHAKSPEADVQAAKQLPIDKQMNNNRLRVQTMLAERFQLKTRIETRDLPVYALVVAPGGIKMKEVEPDPPPAPGTPPQPGLHRPQLHLSAPNQFSATAFPLDEMTVWLSRFDELDGRIVVNETGLTGYYDWVLNGVSQRPQSPDSGGSAAQEPVTSLFTALPEQLGLKLERQKAPVEVLVIEQVQKPSPN